MNENKLRVFWLSNVDLLDKTPNKSGTWVQSMFKMFESVTDIEICGNITFTTHKKEKIINVGGQTHYYMPLNEIKSDGYPSSKAIEFVVNAILKEDPCILHIWGLEMCWGLITRDNRLAKYKKLLEIQGFKSICSSNYVFYGGLGGREVRKMRSLAQWLLPQYRLEAIRKDYSEWEKAESEILSGIGHVSTQSEWVRCVISSLKDDITIHKTGIILRNSFMKSSPWYSIHKKNLAPIIFTTSSSMPYKGFHVTLEAFRLVRKRYSEAKLYVAGISEWKPNLLRGGYNKYIYEKIREMGILDAVVFMGNLAEEDLLVNMYRADVFVISSYIESYCLALAEALAVGVPTVSSNSSALPELISDGENAFLYPTGDKYVCASKIIQLFENPELSYKFSRKSSSWYRAEKNSERILKSQIEIYKKINTI